MLPVSAFLQHSEKTVHDQGVLCSDVFLSVEMGMEIVEIENHRLYGIYQYLAVEMVPAIPQADLHHLEIPAANFLLSGQEAHHGIEEKRQLSFHAIVALRRAEFDAAYQGASEGEPRNTDKPANRMEDIHRACDILAQYPGVDASRVGIPEYVNQSVAKLTEFFGKRL